MRILNIVHRLSPKSLSLIVAAVCSVVLSATLLWLHVVNLGSHAQANCTPNAILLNPCRPWFGAAAWGNPGATLGDAVSQFDYLEQLIGHPMDIYRSYHSPPGTNSLSDLPLNATELHFAARPNTYLDINWKPASTWLDADGGNAIINGDIAKAANNIKAIAPEKVFLTIWWEPQLDVNPPNCSGGSNGVAGTPAQYIAMWKNVENIFNQQGVTNVVWTMDYSGYVTAECLVPALWPGNNLVDWVVYDSYDHNWVSDGTTWATTVGRFYNVLTQDNSSATNFESKPWGLGEFGTCKNTSPSNTQQYFLDGAASVKAGTYPRLDMYLVYADTGNSSGYGCLTDYDADPSNPPASSGAYDPTKQADFNQLTSAIFGQNPPPPTPTPTVSLNAPSSGATVSGAVAVSAQAAVSSGSITNLTLKANGAVPASCSTSNCSGSWNTSTLTNGSYTIEADTTASDGKTASTTEPVTVSNSHPTTISPPTGINSPSQTANSISLAWTAAQDSSYPGSQLTYHVYRDGNVVGTAPHGATSYTDSGLNPSTYYSYAMAASDPAGNTSALSSAFTQMTQKVSCPAPAAPSGFSASNVSATSASLQWQPVSNPSPSCTITGYVLSRNQVPIAQQNGTVFTDAALIPSTTYSYSVVAVAAGNTVGAAATLHVTTPSPQQPDPGPSVPTSLSATAVSGSQINLAWSLSTDPVAGIKDYLVSRNGSQIGTTTTPSFGDSGLSPAIEYSYQVVAISGEGKASSPASASATTLAVTVTTTPNGATNNRGSSGTVKLTPASSIPILKGTTSVGSGTESSSLSPTVSTLNQTATASSRHTLAVRRAAFLGGGTVGVLAIGVGLWLWWWRPRQRYLSAIPPDLKIGDIIVGSGEADRSHKHQR
ncbi:MAG TPA: Ig-like domain-containing protein [Candidatus Saccharimonadales bacterium]|nr:Ig-like domain-containing protein [Candidatus Saccharimonadales bacterium]